MTIYLVYRHQALDTVPPILLRSVSGEAGGAEGEEWWDGRWGETNLVRSAWWSGDQSVNPVPEPEARAEFPEAFGLAPAAPRATEIVEVDVATPDNLANMTREQREAMAASIIDMMRPR